MVEASSPTLQKGKAKQTESLPSQPLFTFIFKLFITPQPRWCYRANNNLTEWASPLPMPNSGKPMIRHGELMPIIPPSRMAEQQYNIINSCSAPLVPDSGVESCFWPSVHYIALAISSSGTALLIATVSEVPDEPRIAVSLAGSCTLSTCDIFHSISFTLYKLRRPDPEVPDK